MFQKIKNWVKTHKLISLIILIVIIIITSLILFKSKNNTQANYSVEVVKKGSITTTVTGTGQVEAFDTIDLKPKISGDITYIGVKVGQEIKAGTLIASLDAREAKIDLENAELSLEELIEDPDASTLTQKQNLVTKAYNDAWDTTSSAINEMSSILDDLDDLYDGYLGSQNTTVLGKTGQEKTEVAEDSFYLAKKSFKDLNNFYKTLSILSNREEIEELIIKSSETDKLLAKATKDAQIVLGYVISDRDDEENTTAIEIKDNLSSWIETTNGFISSFLSLQNTILENNESLKDLTDGADTIDIKSAELTVQSKRDAYNDHFVRAPIDGVIADLTASIGDTVSSSIGTLITKQKIVSISLNEVDITSVEIGQEVILTFDAIENLSLTGKVSEIDSVGTVSSGVVTYDIKITFDNDNRVKPGMSANVEIITASKKDILVIPSSSIKTRNNISYVEVFDDLRNIIKKEVEIGLSDDTTTEIISGLNEGDEIILKLTNSGNNNSLTNKNTSTLRNGTIPMGGAVMGGMMR